MSHEFESGFTVRQPAWHWNQTHHLVLPEYPDNWDEARKQAGLEWEPELVPVYTYSDEPVKRCTLRCGSCGMRVGAMIDDMKWECVNCGMITDPDFTNYVPVENQQAVLRNDTRKAMGVVTDTFQPITHANMGEVWDALLGSDKAMKFASAGVLSEGRNVWGLAYLDEPVQIAKDDSESFPFLALTLGHVGNAALNAFFTAVRIVCQNTYNAGMADAEARKQMFTFRHTGDVAAKIEEAKRAIRGMRDDFDAWREIAEDLYRIPVNSQQLEQFIFLFLPEPPADVISDRVRDNIDKARSTFRLNYEASPTTDSHRGTALGVLDAAVEYADHLRGFRNRDTYLGRTLLRHEPMKAKALTLIRELVNN